jgi:hypothetical protein
MAAGFLLRSIGNRLMSLDRIWKMASTRTGIHVEISEAVRAQIQSREPDIAMALAILDALAMDALNNADEWTAGEEVRRTIYAKSGAIAVVAIRLTIDPRDKSRALVSWYDCRECLLCDLRMPLAHAEELARDYAATQYNSKPITDRPAMNVRLGTVRKTQPMRFDATDAAHG